MLFIQIGSCGLIYNYRKNNIMQLKSKTVFKYAIPITIIIQLTILIIHVSWDKAFQCKTWNKMLVCRQIKV